MRKVIVEVRLVLALLTVPGLAQGLAADRTAPWRDAVLEWHAGDGIPEKLPTLDGKTMTLYVALRGDGLSQPSEILSWKARGSRTALRIALERTGAKTVLLAQVTTDAKERPLQLALPADALAADESHALVVRFLGHRLELFGNGVLVDEEWPLGSLPPAVEPPSIGPAAARFAVWNRALTDEEVLAVSGGAQGLRERERRILGPQSPVGQFWKPRGFNAHVGDCMPFYHDGRFHLFYLFDRRNHGSKWGLGAHQWAHVSTTNLLAWEHHPMAVGITEQSEGSICTGSTFFHDGIYHAFYAVRMSDGSPAQLCDATSRNGVAFTKQPPLARLRSPYRGGPGRDPVVFRDPASGLFHMLVTTELEDPPVAGRGGCLAQLVSRDLKVWEQREPFIVPGYADQPECPDYFEWRGWYYLLFSNHGVARYRMSRQPLGPWHRPKADAFDGAQVAVMKTAAFPGDRRLGAAFVRRGGYGGELIFREIIQHPDGTLGTRWTAEIMPKTGAAAALGFEPLTAGVSGDQTNSVLAPSQGIAAVAMGNVPVEFRLRVRVRPGANASCFGVRLRGGDRMKGGTELRFEPGRQKVGLRAGDLSSTDESEQMAIYDVDGLDRPFSLDLMVKGDLVDVCVDQRRTLAARIPASSQTGLFLFANDGEVTFEALELRPLEATP